MAQVFPGGAGPNVIVPNWEASGKLRQEYSRNPKKFNLPKWAAHRTVKATQGKYLDLGASEASRVVSLNDHEWADGADRPDRNANLESFEYLPFMTKRYSFPFHVGTRTANQAPWDLVPWMSRVAAQKAMTARTKKALSVCNATNFAGSTVACGSISGGGQWSSATNTNPYILITFLYVMQAINKATQGAVEPNMINCTIDPVVAAVMRKSTELTDFIKQQASAPDIMGGKEFFNKWGIPEYLYGIRMIVEDTVVNSAKKGATDSKGYAMGGDTALFTTNSMNVGEYSEKPDLPPGDDMPTLDTVTVFLYEDMTVENMEDPRNRRITGDVVDDYDVVVTSPKSGYLVTDVLA